VPSQATSGSLGRLSSADDRAELGGHARLLAVEVVPAPWWPTSSSLPGRRRP